MLHIFNMDTLLWLLGTKLLPVLCELTELFNLQFSSFMGFHTYIRGSEFSNQVEWTPLQTSGVLSLPSTLQCLTSQLQVPSELCSGFSSLNSSCLKRKSRQKVEVIIGLTIFVSLLSMCCLLHKSDNSFLI